MSTTSIFIGLFILIAACICITWALRFAKTSDEICGSCGVKRGTENPHCIEHRTPEL